MNKEAIMKLVDEKLNLRTNDEESQKWYAEKIMDICANEYDVDNLLELLEYYRADHN
jgi:hypothetical protein